MVSTEAVARSSDAGAPGLAEMVKESLGKSNLSFTTDFKSGLSDSDYVALTFDTPINYDDTPDLSPILNSIAKSINFYKKKKLLFNTG